MYYSTTKKWAQKTKKIFAEGQALGPRERVSLSRAMPRALGKDYSKKNFGRKLTSKSLYRRPSTWPSAKIFKKIKKLVQTQAEASLPRVCLCRGLLWLTLGKKCLCQVPEIWPSAKP
jgi:hypothetical protein